MAKHEYVPLELFLEAINIKQTDLIFQRHAKTYTENVKKISFYGFFQISGPLKSCNKSKYIAKQNDIPLELFLRMP